jgi:hypothetical protein
MYTVQNKEEAVQEKTFPLGKFMPPKTMAKADKVWEKSTDFVFRRYFETVPSEFMELNPSVALSVLREHKKMPPRFTAREPYVKMAEQDFPGLIRTMERLRDLCVACHASVEDEFYGRKIETIYGWEIV